MDAHEFAQASRGEHVDVQRHRVVGLAVDELLGASLAQIRDFVAQLRRLLKAQPLGRRVHLRRELVDDFGGLAVQKIGGLGDALRVVFQRDFARARRRALFDLVVQAGAGRGRVFGVVAGAQQKRLDQDVDGFLRHLRVGVGAEVGVRFFQGAPVIGDLRRLMMGDFDVGVAFVVAKQNVVFGHEAFDEVAFQNQSLRLGMGGGDLDAPDLRNHHRDARREPFGVAKIAADPPLEVHRLAHVKDSVLGVDHAIHPGQLRQIAQKTVQIEIFVAQFLAPRGSKEPTPVGFPGLVSFFLVSVSLFSSVAVGPVAHGLRAARVFPCFAGG